MAKELGGFVGDSVLEHTNGMWAYFPPIRLNNTNNFFLPTHPWNRLKLKLFSQGLYISAPIFFSSAGFLRSFPRMQKLQHSKEIYAGVPNNFIFTVFIATKLLAIRKQLKENTAKYCVFITR